MRSAAPRRVIAACKRSMSMASRRQMVPASGLRRGGVAPKTGAHAEAHHGHGDAVTENLSPQMQKYIKTEAYLFGEKPLPEGESRKLDIWEIPFWIVVVCTLGLPLIVSNQRGSPSLYDWARDEAEERIRRRLDGKSVEYGYNYAALRAIREGMEEVDIPEAAVPARELAEVAAEGDEEAVGDGEEEEEDDDE